MLAKKVTALLSATPIATDEHCNRLLYSSGMKFCEVSLNDMSSPNGSRRTDLFTDMMFRLKGEVTAIEAWGKVKIQC